MLANPSTVASAEVAEMRHFRLLCILGAVLYPAWGFGIEFLRPDSVIGWPTRLAVGAVFGAAAGLSWLGVPLERHANKVLVGLFSIMLLNQAYMLWANHYEPMHVVAIFLSLGAVDVGLTELSALVWLTVILLAIALGLTAFASLGSAFAPFVLLGVATQQLFFGISLQARLTSARRLAASTLALAKREALLAEAQLLASLGSWEWDMQADCLVGSEQLYRNFGLDRPFGPLKLEALLARVEERDRANLRAALERTAQLGLPVALDCHIVRPDGTGGDMHIRAHRMPAGEQAGLRMVGTVQDVSERKQFEALLKAQNEKLKEVDRVKTDFLNAVSHDVRTPLTTIRGYVELLEDEVSGPLTAGQRDACGHVERAVLRLSRLFDDLLDQAIRTEGTFVLHPADEDLVASTREILASFQPQAREAGVTLAAGLVKDELTIWMDAKRIEQVLANLIGNALKFTPRGGTVRVSVGTDPGGALVEVCDEGPGIAKEDFPKLFQQFSQLEAGAKKPQGTGLGLSISKYLVEAHGGTIGVSSDPGQGARFWFRLPFHEAPEFQHTS